MTSATDPALVPPVESYQPPEGCFDEAFSAVGNPRDPYREVLEMLSELDLSRLRQAIDSHLSERGVNFGVPGGVCTFPVDPVPRLLGAAEWAELEAGLAQRVRALGAFLTDIYRERRIIAAGRAPERLLEALDPAVADLPLPTGSPATVSGLDLVRGADGSFEVLEDNLRTPSGLAYASAARDALAATLPSVPRGLRSPDEAIDLLGQALRAAAPDGRPDPSVALLSDGARNSAWYEHRALAHRLGLPIVTLPDLRIEHGRLVARGPTGALPLDVVYRRTDEDRLVDRGGRTTDLGRILLEPLREGTLACVNAFGNGVGDDKLTHAYVEEMVRFYLDEEPLVRSVTTYDLGDPLAREAAFERLDELVVKPRTGHGGHGVSIVGRLDADERHEIVARVRKHPERYVAQETVMLSSHPTAIDGELVPRHVDLRPFVIDVGGEAIVSTSVLTRVAFAPGEMIVNSSQDGGAKDTWVQR